MRATTERLIEALDARDRIPADEREPELDITGSEEYSDLIDWPATDQAGAWRDYVLVDGRRLYWHEADRCWQVQG